MRPMGDNLRSYFFIEFSCKTKYVNFAEKYVKFATDQLWLKKSV